MGSGGGCHGVRQRRDFPRLNKQNDASVVWGCGEHLFFIRLFGGAELSNQIQSNTQTSFVPRHLCGESNAWGGGGGGRTRDWVSGPTSNV